MIIDTQKRQFNKLRVSITSECNFSCLYCTGLKEENQAHIMPLARPVDSQKLIRIIKNIHQQVQLETIRITGGEPLLNPDAPDIIRALVKMGISDIRMTTNGVMFSRMAGELFAAGLKSVNISLDAVSPDAFKRMSRRDNLQQVFDGIDSAIAAGLEVRLNSVIMRNRNSREIIPLLEYARDKNLIIRFLELMKMGPMHQNFHRWIVTELEILQTIRDKYDFESLPRTKGSTANYWKMSNGQVFGIIANESSPFCADCNRLRLDANGNIYGCISTQKGISTDYAILPEDYQGLLNQALAQKQNLRFTGHERSMQMIGG
jgi:Molybdenum cofactor biosynthesis enzyme